jgi:hypothetical protein
VHSPRYQAGLPVSSPDGAVVADAERMRAVLAEHHVDAQITAAPATVEEL